MPLLPEDPHGVAAAFDLAMFYGDYGLAEKILADPRMPVTFTPGHTAPEPVALLRAYLAFLRGKKEAARQAADEAIAFYASKHWVPNQDSAILIATARAQAFAGRADEAVQNASQGVARTIGRNAQQTADALWGQGLVLATLGRREEALAVLERLMEGPCRYTPQEVRHDPLWSRLADDPRFEKFLRKARAL